MLGPLMAALKYLLNHSFVVDILLLLQDFKLLDDLIYSGIVKVHELLYIVKHVRLMGRGNGCSLNQGLNCWEEVCLVFKFQHDVVPSDALEG
jgi:hypothetical protein